MANFFKFKDRRVIPNFRSFQKTARIGGLKSSFNNIERSLLHDPHISYLSDEWSVQNNLGLASEILSTGLLVDPNSLFVKEAASYVLNQEKASKSQILLSQHILANEVTHLEDEKTLSWFIEENHIKTIYARISKYKKQCIDFPRDALSYVELSWLYLILGQIEQANKNMSVALNLGGQNRYVLRSAIRLFVHFGEFDMAQYYLRKYKFLKFDPQILSAEIALATLRNRNSPFLKFGQGLIDLNKFSAYGLTELSAALGTVELIDGSLKSSKKYFETALLDPNDNSLAQVEWATNEASLFNFDLTDFKSVAHNYEAFTIDSYYRNDWKGALQGAEKWFIDSPFSTRPIRLASFVALTYLDKPELAISFCKAGLSTHPFNPSLINDLSYALGLLNRIEEASKYLNQINIKDVTDSVVKNVLIATKGLIEFRKGNDELGRTFYLKSIENLKSLNKDDLSKIATLNYIREELLFNSNTRDKIKPLFDKIMSDKSDVLILKNRIQKLLE